MKAKTRLFFLIGMLLSIQLIAQTVITETGNTNFVNIPDNNTTGGTAQIFFNDIPNGATLTAIDLSLEINHNTAGDLKMVLRAPTGDEITLVNRPARVFAPDDIEYARGNLSDSYPISFSDNATYSAKLMGGNGTVAFPVVPDSQTICDYTGICDFYPDDDSNNPETLASFMADVSSNGGPSGTWRVIISDLSSGTIGFFKVENIGLTYEYDFPVAICQDGTFTLNSNSEQTINANQINNGSSSPNGPLSLSINNNFFDCSNLGDNTVTLTITDINGVSDTCEATVTIEPNAATPTITCPGDITVYTGIGESIVVNYDMPETTGCFSGALTQTFGFVSGASISAGSYVNTFEIEDINGTIRTCSFNVTVNEVDLSAYGNPYITKWHVVENEDGINDRSILLPTKGNGYDFVIDWGDGTSLEFHDNGNILPQHVYEVDGDYSVKIYGDYPRSSFFDFPNYPIVYEDRLLEVEQWGDIQWDTMENAFRNCTNVNVTATDIPDLSIVTTTRFMFHFCINLIGNDSFNDWNVENLENTSGMFFFARDFNQPLNDWDVSNVTNMGAMFQGASDFDQPLNDWDVSNVESMGSLFNESGMNQDLSDWDISSLTSAGSMFSSNPFFSTENYDATLIGWARLDPGETQIPTNVNLTIYPLTKYCASYEEHDLLENVYNWNISDGGIQGPECIKETRVVLENGKLTITDIENDSADQITLSNDGIILTISNLIEPKVSGNEVILLGPTTVTIPIANITNGIEINLANGSNSGFNNVTFVEDLTLTGVDNDITLTGLKDYIQNGSINIEGDLTISGIGFSLTLGEITANNFTINGVNRILDQDLALTISGVTQLQAEDEINIEYGQLQHTFGGEVNLTSGELIFTAGANTTFGEINATDQGVGLPHTFTITPGDITFNGDVTILGSNANLYVCGLSNISQTGGSIETPFLIFRGNENTTVTFNNNNNNIDALGTSNPFDANAVNLASLSFNNINNMFLETIHVNEFDLTAPEFDFEPGFTNIIKEGSGISNFNANIDVNNGTGTAFIYHNAGTINFNGTTNDFNGAFDYIGAIGTTTNFNGAASFDTQGISLSFGFLNVSEAFTLRTFITTSNEARFNGSNALLKGFGTLSGGPVIIENNGALTPGILGAVSNIDLSDLLISSGTFAPVIESDDDFDILEVVGTITLTDATFSPVGGFTAQPDTMEMILIDNDGNDPVVGTFNNLPEGSEVTFGDFTGIISYLGGDGNDVVLSQDNIDPIAICQDITLSVGLGGITVTGDQLDGGSTDNVGITEILINGETSLDLTFDDLGDNQITITFADGNGNSAECMATITLTSNVTLPILISEYQPAISGVPTQDIEIKGEPGESFAGTFVVLEGISSNNIGNVLSADDFSGTFDANGLLTATIPDLRNPSHTVVLTSSFSGTVGTDVDTDDDGTVDNMTNFGLILDAIGITNGAVCCPVDVIYGVEFGGVDLIYINGQASAVFRDASVGDFYQISLTNDVIYDNNGAVVSSDDFDVTPTANGTFGQINPTTETLDPNATFTYNNGWSPMDPSGISTATNDIEIVSGDAVISTSTSCNSVVINAGASLRITAGMTFNVASGMTLQSTSTNYSSLLGAGIVSGTISYERFTNSNALGNDLISAPLSGQTWTSFLDPTNSNALLNDGGVPVTTYLYGPFNKSTSAYENYNSNTVTNLISGVGYRAATNSGETLVYTGTVPTGTVSVDIINSGSQFRKWNLVGNPFPSYLNVQSFLTHEVGGGTTNIELFDLGSAAIYGYDGDSSNGWTIYNLANTTASTVIAPGQGFFVSANTDNVAAFDLEFTQSMRTSGSADDFINGRNAELIFLSLNIRANDKSSNTDFYFNPNATEGMDVGYDAKVWGGVPSEFGIYSQLVEDNVGESFALQTMHLSSLTEVTIPLGVNVNQGEQFTIAIESSSLPQGTQVYLEDAIQNTFTLLNTNDYVYTPSVDLNGTGRYFVRFSDETLSNPEIEANTLSIYTLKDQNEIVINGQLQKQNKAELFDVNGKKVIDTSLDANSNYNTIDIEGLASGIYIFKVSNKDDVITKKVIIF